MRRLFLGFLLLPALLCGKPDYGDAYPLNDGEYRLESSQIWYLAKCKEPVTDHSGRPVVDSGTYLVELRLKGVLGKWLIVQDNASSALTVEGQFLSVPRSAAAGTVMTLQGMNIVGTDLYLYPYEGKF